MASRSWGQDISKLFSRVESGRVRRCSKSHGSERVGSGGFHTSQDGSGRVALTRPEREEVVRLVRILKINATTGACENRAFGYDDDDGDDNDDEDD